MNSTYLRGRPTRRAALLLRLVVLLSLLATMGGLLATLPLPVAYAATINVTTAADTVDAGQCYSAPLITIASLPGPDGVTSLREAVCAAQNTAGADNINMSAITGQTITLAIAGNLYINSQVDISGADVIVDGNNTILPFFIGGSGIASISDLTIRNGLSANTYAGGGIAAIDNSNLTLTRVTVTANNAVGLETNNSSNGGGIGTRGTLTVIDSTISNNRAQGNGGGISVDGSGVVRIINSTISGNRSDDESDSLGNGGGIFLATGGTRELYSVTITNNRAVNGLGGGVHGGNRITSIRNSIIVGNIAPGDPDCGQAGSDTPTSQGYNLFPDDGDCGTAAALNPNDQFITRATFLTQIGALAVNAPGTTATHALLTGNTAIDGGNPAGCVDNNGTTLANDQRGVARADGDGNSSVICDIGAYEFVPSGSNTAPTVVGAGIPDQNVNEDAANTVLDLTSFFADTEDGAAGLTYAVQSNTNAALFTSTAIAGTDLTLDYAPDANGTATITIRATDSGSLFVEDTFVVTVASVNDPPAFTKGANITVSQGSGAFSETGWATGISVGPANESGQSVLFSVSPVGVPPILFTATGAPSIAPDGTLTFELDAASPTGSGTFEVVLEDDGGTANGGDDTSDAQTFTITVVAPAPPDVVGDGIPDVTVDEDAPDEVIQLTDYLTDTDDLTYEVMTNTNQLLFSSVTVDAAGRLILDFAPDANGTATITVRATDTVDLFVEDTFVVTVNPVNDPPVNTVPGPQTTDYNTALTFSSANGNQVSISDGEAISATVSLTITNGILTLSQTTGLVFGAGDGTDDSSLVFTGTITDINAALSNMVFTPAFNFSGAASIVISTSDLGSSGSGGPQVDTDTIAITVAAPGVLAAVDDTYSTPENTTLTVSAAEGVLANDQRVRQDDVLTATLVFDVSHGNLTFNSDGSFTYTPDNGYLGPDGFVYRVTDGVSQDQGNVSIDVGTVLPVAQDDTYVTEPGQPLEIGAPGILGNDTPGSGGDTLTATLVSDVSNGTLVFSADGSFTYTPDARFSGEDTFTYKANDGQNDSNEATVTIRVGGGGNNAPTAANDSYATLPDTRLDVPVPGVLSNDDDLDEDALTALLVSDVSNGTLTLNSSGAFSYIPNTGFIGTDTFTYRANDGFDDSNTATVTIRVRENTPPTAVNDSYTTAPGTVLNQPSPGVLSNDIDAEDDPLTATLVSDVSNGTLILDENGGFSYTPGAGFIGTDTFTYRAGDGIADSNVATVTIRVREAGPTVINLPIVMRPEPTVTPPPVKKADLVATVSLSPNKKTFKAGEAVVISVRVTNQGETATTSRFWVDLYINPKTLPTASTVPMLWEKNCGIQPCFGIAWAVNRTLQPGESVTLTSQPGNYASAYTRWPGWFASGTRNVYAYVDSWNPNVTTGAVLEENESNNRGDLTGLSVTGTNPPFRSLTETEIPARPAP